MRVNGITWGVFSFISVKNTSVSVFVQSNFSVISAQDKGKTAVSDVPGSEWTPRRVTASPTSATRRDLPRSSSRDKWRDETLARCRYNMVTFPAVSPRRPYIPLNPLLRRRGTAREIRQDDGRPLNSLEKLRGGRGRLPEDAECTYDEMKFWSARSRSLRP